MAIVLREVTLRNYKSIAACKVGLTDLTLLVGPNGAGKSNFIDALRFVAESLNSTIEYAIRQRGGIGEVRRRSGGHPNHFAISLRLNLEEGQNANYAVQIGARPRGGFNVQHEQAAVSGNGIDHAYYEVKNGSLVKSANVGSRSKIESDRLFLTTLSAESSFRLLYDALSSMGFYNINPGDIREPQPHDRGDILARSGANLAAVIKRLKVDDQSSFDRVQQYLRNVVPGVERVEYKALGPRETLEFFQRVQNAQHPWRFYATAMSDGTLRSLGVLVALFQSLPKFKLSKQFIAIEEPESTIHPGAAAILMDALLEASGRNQVLSTTHSPDLLDHKSVQSANLLAVSNESGQTLIAPVDQASRSAIRDKLYTAGELLRSRQLQPDLDQARTEVTQSDLFHPVA